MSGRIKRIRDERGDENSNGNAPWKRWQPRLQVPYPLVVTNRDRVADGATVRAAIVTLRRGMWTAPEPETERASRTEALFLLPATLALPSASLLAGERAGNRG